MMKEFKDKSLLQISENGTVEAVFSVFNEIDSDNDVVLPNAIRSGYGEKGVVMCWGHDWKQIIGKGKIVTDENKATFKGKFNMTTNAGKEAYETVKAMEDMQQWSFGFEVNDSEMGTFTKDSGESQEVRYLKDVKVWEVSPVMVGANQNTYTLAIKEAKEQDEIVEQEENKDLGIRFTDEVDNLLIKMTALLKRSKELTALRLSKNKTLSEGSIEELEKLKDALQDMHQDIDTLLNVGTDDEAQVMVADDHYEEVNDLFKETNELLNDTLMIDLGEINE